MIYKSRIEQRARERRCFNPADKKDISEFRFFLTHEKWPHNQCPFYLEWPYLTIPDMIKDQFARYTLGVDKEKNVG